MEDMMRMYMPDSKSTPTEAKLLLNLSSPLIGKLADGAKGDRAKDIARQVYMLAVLANRKLSADEMKRFQKDSFTLLGDLL